MYYQEAKMQNKFRMGAYLKEVPIINDSRHCDSILRMTPQYSGLIGDLYRLLQETAHLKGTIMN